MSAVLSNLKQNKILYDKGRLNIQTAFCFTRSFRLVI